MCFHEPDQMIKRCIFYNDSRQEPSGSLRKTKILKKTLFFVVFWKKSDPVTLKHYLVWKLWWHGREHPIKSVT